MLHPPVAVVLPLRSSTGRTLRWKLLQGVRPTTRSGKELPLPGGCKVGLCSLHCIEAHRSTSSGFCLILGYAFPLPANNCFRNWQQVHTPERAVPISWDLLQALGAVYLTWSVALMLYVSFFGFLRTSEILGLQMFHLILHERRPQISFIGHSIYAKTSNGNLKSLCLRMLSFGSWLSPCKLRLRVTTFCGLACPTTFWHG